MADSDNLPTAECGALDGMRVLDVATFIAAPYCATILGEFGAEVIKVELPKTGDATRNFGTRTASGETLPWLSEGRNKKSVTLDLRKPEGAAILKRLASHADILCENFQPGTMEGWGLGWSDLRAINPRLVMVRVSGYGQTGPYRDRPGFGRIANAFGGISFLAGYPDRAPVTPGSATLADYLSGLYAGFGALVAIEARRRTHAGQVVDVALYESIFRILDELAPAYALNGFVRQRMGPATVNAVPHSHYPTRDGKWVAIACTNDRIFARLAVLMAKPELAGDGIYGTIAQRETHREAVDALVTAWTGTMTQSAVIEACARGQVPCGMVASIAEIFDDPHYRARENILRVADARVGELAIANVVPRLTATPGKVKWLGPALGQHNGEVYGGLLGMTAPEMAALARAGVI